jgi:inositol-hexakisphosphate 5-kinase
VTFDKPQSSASSKPRAASNSKRTTLPYSSPILSHQSYDHRSQLSSLIPNLSKTRSLPMGTLQNVTLERSRSPLGSPIRLSTSPIQSENDMIPPLDAEEEAERLRYRSWREGNPELRKSPGHKNARSKSGDPHKKSRKIEATLPNIVEGPPKSSRSRKSSQYLGLFKEKDAIEEPQQRKSKLKQKAPKEEKGRQKSSPSIISSPETSYRQKQRPSPIIEANEAEDGDSRGVYEALAHGGPRYRHASTSTVSSSRSQPDLQTLFAQGGKTELSPRPRTREGSVGAPSFAEFQLPPPAEEIDLPIRKQPGTGLTTELMKVVGQTDSAPDTEGEDSDREHISSAMYYPHRQLRPDMSPELEGAIRPAVSRTQSATTRSELHEGSVAEDQSALPHTGSPEEVEIAFQGEGNRQLWKADYPIPSKTPEDPIELTSEYDFGGESSMSDFESHDESAASTYGYDSEEEETKGPSTSTPKSRPTGTNTRRRDSRHPLGAVELKPFNHQVGGHSTVYQFSRRAVCKQLNNRENVFYETVEKYHPELLEFMPR